MVLTERHYAGFGLRMNYRNRMASGGYSRLFLIWRVFSPGWIQGCWKNLLNLKRVFYYSCGKQFSYNPANVRHSFQTEMPRNSGLHTMREFKRSSLARLADAILPIIVIKHFGFVQLNVAVLPVSPQLVDLKC